jgi:hypothetical protein
MSEIVVSKRDGIVTGPDGVKHRVYRGKTLADAAHPIVQAHPNDWVPMHVELALPGAHVPPAASHAEQLQHDNDLDVLRNDLAEAEETAETLTAELTRLAGGLATRGYELPDEDDREPGWLVDLVLRSLDEAPPAGAVPPPKPPRAPKPRVGRPSDAGL